MEIIRMKVKIEVALSAEDVLEKLGRKITSDFGNIKVDGENLFELTEYDEIEETEVAKRVRSEIIEHIQATLGLYDDYSHYVFDVIYDYDDDVFHRNRPVKVWVYFKNVI